MTKELTAREFPFCDAAAGSYSTDVTRRITFNAVGYQSVNSTCQQIEGKRPDEARCNPLNATIHGTLYSPLDFTPEWPTNVAPGARDAPGCTRNSMAPTWTVNDFSMASNIPIPFAPVTVTYPTIFLDFTVRNTAIDYAVHCFNLVEDFDYPFDNDDGFHVTKWEDCSVDEHNDWPPDGIHTSVAFGGDTGTLYLNQTWYCNDEDKDHG